MNIKEKTKGFTIIEVVLVLAIAGLIFLIVFLAVPALQRNQRDAQRRADGSRVTAALQNYQANNNGDLPTNATTFRTSYVVTTAGDRFAEPNGTDYALSITTATGTVGSAPTNLVTPNTGTFALMANAKCSGENVLVGTARQMAVRIALEGGGFYCQDNS